MLVLEDVDSHQLTLNNAVELNRQLHASVQRKEEQISALKEQNAQLNELITQADLYAAMLNEASAFPPRPGSAPTRLSRCSSADFSQWHFTASEPSWLSSILSNEEEEDGSSSALFGDARSRKAGEDGVKRQLWPSQGDESRSSGIDSGPCQPQNAKRLRSELHGSEQSILDSLQTSEISDTSDRRYSHAVQALQVLTAIPSLNSKLAAGIGYDEQEDEGSHSALFRDNRCRRLGEDRELRPSQGDKSSCDSSDFLLCSGKDELCQPQDAKRLRSELHKPIQSEQTISDSLQSSKNSNSDVSSHHPHHRPGAVWVYGAFHGLQVSTAVPRVNSELPAGIGEEEEAEEGVCFRIYIREHGTVRTRAFPHGKTFTSHTPDGSCRFLWVPKDCVN